MKVKDNEGNIHDMNPIYNTFVTTFREKQWRHMNHIYHLCKPPCEVDNPLSVYVFDPKQVEKFLGMRFDEFRRWTPSEEEFEAWEMHCKNRPIKPSEVDRFCKELEDGNIWKELEGE